MFVSDPLLIDAHALHCEYAVILAKPSGVELIVWHHKQEDTSDRGSQKAGDEEDDLPGSNGGTVQARASGDAISYQTSKDLRETIEAEPGPRSQTLFSLRVPLLMIRL